MKKNKLFLFMAIALALGVSSCGNDNIDINPNKTTHNDSYEERLDTTPKDAKAYKKDIYSILYQIIISCRTKNP